MTSPPYRRQSDPPEGSPAARWSDALRPWLPILTAVLAVWSVVAAVLLAVGFSIITPSEIVGRNSARLTVIEGQVAEIQTRAEKGALLTMALVRSKCLELDVNSRAISVLPCDAVFARPNGQGSISPMGYGGTVAGAREPMPPPENNRPREYAHPAGRGWGIVLADEPSRSGP